MGAAAETIANDEMQSVADAMRDAATATADHAARVNRTVIKVGSQAARGVSRVAYSSCYVLSYAIVYTAVFAVHALPQRNPVMHGFRDGGRAARSALKSKA